MRLDVAFLPQLVAPEAAVRNICVVIDVLRATTTLTTLVACGAASIAVAADAADARAAKHANPGALLLGETGGLRPPDFDLGNSPRDLAPDLVAGRLAICHTSNGTAAIRAVASAPVVLLGCLRNSAAVAGAAVRLAHERDLGITLVCAGGGGGRHFALDDALVAGQLVAALLGEVGHSSCHAAPIESSARAASVEPIDLSEAALAARTLRQSALGLAHEPAHAAWEGALRRTAAGQHLAQIGLGDDIPFCAEVDRETAVPLARTVGAALLIGAL